MTPAEQTFTLLEESQGQAQITTVSMTHWEADRPGSINIQGPGHNVTPEQDCFCLICLSSIWFICRMKAVSFLRSWLEISVYPPCLSLPAPNLYKEQPYRRYLQLPVWLGRGSQGHYMSSLPERILHHVFHMDLRRGGLAHIGCTTLG